MSSNSLDIRNIAPTIADGLQVDLPQMMPVRQLFANDHVPDIEEAVRQEMLRFSGLDLHQKKIAITAGSRGIKGMVEVLRAVASELGNLGAEPFLVPAMGSHGGGTAEGQIAVLEKLGITEATVGAPIRSSMDVVELGAIPGGTKVHCDKLAFESDGIVVCNRIKAHTAYKGENESGLVKMMVIGLGKHKGATAFHRLGFDHFHHAIPAAGDVFLANAPVLFGVGLVENAYGKAAAIEGIEPDRILERDRELLRHAKAIMGRLLVPDIDVLIVDEIGKDISGGGMDSNVTGRSTWGLPGFDAPPIQRISVRDLTKATAGSAMGLGMADFTTKRCAGKIDLAVTYTNALTALALLPPKIPMIVEDDRYALAFALRTVRTAGPGGARIVHIKNTKDLEDIWVSEAYLPDLSGRDDVLVRGDPQPIRFDQAGDLIPWPMIN
jgi:lactate racemase-like protein